MDYNQHLAPKEVFDTDGGGGKGFIETPADMSFNIIYQTRPELPSEFENALGDGLQTLFRQDVVDLSGLVAGLNTLGLKGREGKVWTEGSFEAEMLKHNDGEMK